MRLIYLIFSRPFERVTEYSDCPEQKGVIYTKWGTVSVGPLIAGIASAFERTNSSTDVDNVWLATLGGMLGQAIINQATDKPNIFNTGVWNNTIKPGKFYLKGNHWDGNVAQLLGAIDGMDTCICLSPGWETFELLPKCPKRGINTRRLNKSPFEGPKPTRN